MPRELSASSVLGAGIDLRNLPSRIARTTILNSFNNLSWRHHRGLNIAQMNCPVRTDEDYLEHPEYNQNPPFLAPELTTNKDLNGTVNSREHDESDVGNDFLLTAKSSVQHTSIDAPENCEDHQCAGTWSFSMFTVTTYEGQLLTVYSETNPHTLMDYGGEDQVHLHDSLSRLASAESGSGNLIQWLSTVALCSIVSFVVGTQSVTGRKQPGQWEPNPP